MFISTVAIRRPVFTAMFILALIVFGLVSLSGLGIDLMPKIDFPIVTVITTVPGADPETIENNVTDPIEEAVNTLDGIKTLTSTSAEGYSLVVVEFQLEKDINVAYQEVQARVNSVQSDLDAAGAEAPVIEKVDFDAAPILTVVVSGDLSDRDLFDLADKQIKERLQRVRDVGSIKLVGGREQKLWLWLDADRMKQHGLTAQDVRAALLSQHVEMPGGRVEDGRVELVTRTKAEFPSAAELNELIVSPAGSIPIRLHDVGYAEDGLEEFRSYSQRDDKPGIAIQVRRQSGTNTVQVARDVKAEIEKLRAELAQRGVRLDITIDLSTYIERSVEEVYGHLLMGGALAVLTVLVFLLNVRSTFISAMVLPTSILATFMMMAAMDFTLNRLTLMAMTLAVGLLIDDAIVVQENIMRHVQAGKPASFAAEFATKEIGLAVLATTFSVVAVFLPTAYTKGLIGRFIFPFGMTVSFAVLISMLVSFTLDPMLSSRMLRKVERHNVLFRFFEAGFHGIEGAYRVVLGWCLRHRLVVGGLALLLLVGLAVSLLVPSLGLRRYIKVEFQPTEDRSEFDVMVKAPLGASLQRTREILEGFRARIKAVPEVAYTFYAIGADELGKVNEGTIYVRLLPKQQRQKARQRSQQAVMEHVRALLAAVPVLDTRVAVQQANMMGGGKSTQIQYELCGSDLKVLERLAAEHLVRMRQDPGFTDLDTTYEPGRPETSILVDRARADDLGVSPAVIADTIRAGIGGVDVTKFRAGKDRYDIAVRLLESGRSDPNRILDLSVPSRTLGTVEMRSVASIAPSSVPVEINRYNRQRSITVLANLRGDKPQGNASRQVEGITQEIGLPPGYSANWGGMTQHMDEAFQSLTFTMMLSVIVIYMVLAAQFESLVHPFTIMLSLPLAFVGALAALLLLGQTINILTFMAFIFLLGLVTKNAILLIDYTNKLRDRDGLEKTEALRTAGPIRLRPILMTSIAMILGMLPSAVGTGEGSEGRQPMGIAIIGGLVSSTLLTLLVVPVVYSLIDPLSEWFRRKVLKPRDQAEPPSEASQPAE